RAQAFSFIAPTPPAWGFSGGRSGARLRLRSVSRSERGRARRGSGQRRNLHLAGLPQNRRRGQRPALSSPMLVFGMKDRMVKVVLNPKLESHIPAATLERARKAEQQFR